MKEKINIAVIGVGCRGNGMVGTLCQMDDVNIVGICDLYEDRVKEAADKVEENGRSRPIEETDYERIFKIKELDSVYIATDWETHIKIAIAAMKCGIPAAVEVGGAYSIDECWGLVDAYEKTGTWAMMMENCCYGERELMVHNMVRQGMFGDIVYCSGKYAHDLRYEVGYGTIRRHYRLRNYLARNCENYPTHELGPIAKLLNINRGNRFTSLISVCSNAQGMHDYVNTQDELKEELGDAEFAQADIVKTFIKTEHGEMIELTLDTTLTRFYSRGYTIRGKKGLYQEDGDILYFDTEEDRKQEWTQSNFWGRGAEYAKTYNHPLWNSMTQEQKDLGHGGMDWFVLRAWIEAVKNDTLPPIDVYDAAAWMCITPLSEQSIKSGSKEMEIPDFTRGKYKNRQDPVGDGPYDIK